MNFDRKLHALHALQAEYLKAEAEVTRLQNSFFANGEGHAG